MMTRSRNLLFLSVLVLAACSPALQTTSAPQATALQTSIAPTDSETDLFTTFVILADESKASYTVEEEFLAGALAPLGIDASFNTAFGWTRNIEGQMSLNLNQDPPIVGENSFVVNIRSLSSDENRRDEMIQRRFLESNLFPLAEFVISSIENFPAESANGQLINFTLIGQMTIREMTQPFTFKVEAVLDGQMLTGTATGSLTMSDFGFQPPSIAGILTVSDPAIITLEFTMQAFNNGGD